jgi:photosystem II stability/assembly factor-like uncharacterized protein
VSTVDPNIIVAQAQSIEFPFFTTNGGTTWQRLYSNPSDWGRAYSISIVAGTTQTLRMIFERTIVESNDFGKTWVTVSELPTGTWLKFIQHPTRSSVWFVMNYTDLLRSNDAGATWTKVYTATGYTLRNVALTPAQPAIVLLESNDKLYESKDTGATFTEFSYTGILSLKVDLLAGDVATPDRYYGYFGGRLAISTDRGRTWIDRTEKNILTITGIVQESTTPATLYAWGTNLWKSLDHGQTWTVADTMHTARLSAQLVNGQLYVGCYQSGIYRGNAQATSWTKLDRGMNYLEVRGLIRYTDRTWFYQGVNDVMKTTDAGETWTTLTPVKYDQPSGGRVYAFAVAPSNPNMMYGGTNSDIYRSTNGGQTWTGSGYNEPVESISIHPADPNDAVCGGLYSLRRTTDGGTTWKRADINVHGIHVIARSPVNANYLLATSDSEVYASTDGGITWSKTSTLPEAVQAIVGDAQQASKFYVAGGIGVRYTTDLGATWQDPWRYPYNVAGLAFDPADPNTFYCVQSGGRGLILRFRIDPATVDTVFEPDWTATNGPIKHLLISNGKLIGGAQDGLLWFDPTPVSVRDVPVDIAFREDEVVTVRVYNVRGMLMDQQTIRGRDVAITTPWNFMPMPGTQVFFIVFVGESGQQYIRRY